MLILFLKIILYPRCLSHYFFILRYGNVWWAFLILTYNVAFYILSTISIIILVIVLRFILIIISYLLFLVIFVFIRNISIIVRLWSRLIINRRRVGILINLLVLLNITLVIVILYTWLLTLDHWFFTLSLRLFYALIIWIAIRFI